MEIIARHYETLQTSYDGSQSLRRGTNIYNNDVYNEAKKPQEKQPRGANSFFFYHNIKFRPSLKSKNSQVRIKYW